MSAEQEKHKMFVLFSLLHSLFLHVPTRLLKTN